MINDSNFYTEKELDSINYFKGKGYYARFQDPSVASNIFDTRQSFLLKMHNYLNQGYKGTFIAILRDTEG